MLLETPQVKEFKERLHDFPREKLLEIIEEQNPSYIFDINRVEWVFRNKLSHLNDDNGNPIVQRDLTHEELVRLVDPPFMFSKEMMRNGFGEDMQRQIHIASDPILWSKNILNATPRVYQALVLREPNDNVVLRWGRRLGKALDIDTDIPTPSGWKKMGDLQDGDQVFDENGQICNVTAVTDVQNDHECYEVTFSDGTSLFADADHEWAVHDQADRIAITGGQPRPLQHLTTQELAKNVLGPYSTTRTEHNYSVPLTKPVEYPAKELKLHPWVYGYLVANGIPSTTNVKVLPKDIEEVSVRFSEYGYELKNIKGNKYQVIGLAPNSFESYSIRDEYMFGSLSQRYNLLTGLCDAKGTVTTDYVEFQVSEKPFVDQVDELVCSLGGEVRRREKVNRVKGVDYGTSYRAFWLANFPCLSLERKQPKRPVKGGKSANRIIVSIEKVESRPVKCISVDSRSRLYLAGRQFVPTHNSYVLSMYILWYSFVHEKARTLVLAPAKTQVGLIYDQILELADLSPIVSEAITKSPRSPQYEVYLSNGSIIRLFTTGFRSGQKADNTRGQEADMIVLDEMDYMGTDDLVALMAMLQKTDPNKQFKKKLIGASTPTGQRNTYWRWNTDPDEGFSAFWFPSMVNPLWDKEEEAAARRRYRNEQHYRHEIEADWGEDAEGVYPRKYVDLAFGARKLSEYDTFKPDHDKCIYALGVDWDKHGAGVNIVVTEADKKNPGTCQIRVVYREEIVKGEFTYIESIDEIVELDKKFRFKHVYVDQGAGEVQAEMLHKHGLQNPHTNLHTKTKACHFSNTIELRDPYTRQIEKKRLKPFMVENLVFHLEQKRIAFQEDDDEMYLQLISYIKIRETESGNPVFAPGGETVDHAHDALLLALFAFTENYDSLFQGTYKDGPKAVSNEFFINSTDVTDAKSEEKKKKKRDDEAVPAVKAISRGASFGRTKNRKSSGSIKRPMF